MRKITTIQPGVSNGQPNIKVTTQTSWGSFFAAIAGGAGTVAPFVPPGPYQWLVAGIAGAAGALATKLP